MQAQQGNSQVYKTSPIISFIITYYNQPIAMLCECLESVLRLSLNDEEREIILIDDGSSVSPINNLNKYRNHLIYIYQKNKGVSVARNRGIEISSGSYIQFIDADDYLEQIPYEHCIDMIRSSKADMIMFRHTTKKFRKQKYKDCVPTTGAEYMLHNNIYGSACGYIVRKKTIGDLRFSEGVSYSEDEEFTAQITLRTEHFIRTDAKAYFYRQHKSSAIHDKQRIDKRIDDIYHVILRLKEVSDRMSKTEQEALQRRVAQLTMDYIYNIITLTKDKKQVEQAIEKLHSQGLFPLPDKNYTSKYKWFRKTTNTKLGRQALCLLLPKQL
ncbi:MAG: glycosyltransferase [Prevotella sp.]|nr:glycosyltransferase [Prevotella sp.]